MITQDEMLAAAASPEIAGLDFGALGEDDIVNLIAQRSEIIFDADDPAGVIKQWSQGREEPIRDLARARGAELARRAAGAILAEYAEIRPALHELAPRSIADIGCGYAFFDLFFWRDFPGRVVLIDLEATPERHFGYQGTGAAYSSLARAKAFLVANGVTARSVSLVNPGRKPLPRTRVDLAVSFLSCGFHYPVETYAEYFRDGVTGRGAIILDLRGRRQAAAQPLLEALGPVRELTRAAGGKAARVMVRKG